MSPNAATLPEQSANGDPSELALVLDGGQTLRVRKLADGSAEFTVSAPWMRDPERVVIPRLTALEVGRALVRMGRDREKVARLVGDGSGLSRSVGP